MRTFFDVVAESATPSPKTFLHSKEHLNVRSNDDDRPCLLLPPVHRLNHPLVSIVGKCLDNEVVKVR